MKTKIIMIVIVVSVAFAAGFFTSNMMTRRSFSSISDKLTEAKEETDKANSMVHELMDELKALKSSRGERINSAKVEAVQSVDVISNDHSALVELWNNHIREYRNSMERK